MKKLLPKLAVKLVLFWIVVILMMLLTILISNVLHITAGGIFENEAALPYIGAAISAVGLIGFLIMDARIVRYQRKLLEDVSPVTFAGIDTALLAFMLMPLAIVGTATGTKLFIGISGNIFAPFLALSELGLPVCMSVLFCLLLFFAVDLLAARKVKKMPLPTPEEDASEIEE